MAKTEFSDSKEKNMSSKTEFEMLVVFKMGIMSKFICRIECFYHTFVFSCVLFQVLCFLVFNLTF